MALGIGITYGKLLFCHIISEESEDKNILAKEYNNRTVYYWFNNPFTDDFDSPHLNLSPITIDDITRPNKRSWYNPYLIPASISVASENFVINLTNPYDYTLLFILPSDYPPLYIH